MYIFCIYVCHYLVINLFIYFNKAWKGLQTIADGTSQLSQKIVNFLIILTTIKIILGIDPQDRLLFIKNHPYFYQVQGELAIAGRKFCDLLIYTFKDICRISIERDDLFITQMFAKLDLFYENYLSLLEIGLSRAIIAIPGHIMFAIAMGYYLSIYKFNSKNKNTNKINLFKILFIPIILHGFFDFLLMIKTTWATVVFLLYLIYLWKISLDKVDIYTDYARKRFIRLRTRRKRK